MIGTERAVTHLQGFAEKLGCRGVLSHLELQRSELDQRRQILRSAVASFVRRGRGPLWPIREDAVAIYRRGIGRRFDATVEAGCGVGHTLEPPTVIRLTGQNDIGSCPDWRVDRLFA